MALVNQLQNAGATDKVLAHASGKHVVQGHLLWSYTIGTDPNHRIVVRHALADVRGGGRWKGPLSVYFSGLNVATADYEFFDGSQTATGTLFDTDVPHFRTVILDVKGGTGVGDADTKSNPPTGDAGVLAICECEMFPDFDSSGNQVDPADGVTVVATPGQALDESYFTYTVNPARVLAGWYLKYCEDAVRDDINWTIWSAWRDYLGGTETVDYTTLVDFDGFGLTGSYYSGTLFNTFVGKRVDPVLSFALSSGTPLPGVTSGSFSVRWEGKIKPTYSETYTFKIIHDNGARLWVNGVQIINQWNDSGTSTPGTHTGTIALTAGQFYDIKAEWNEGGVVAEFQLLWSSASQSEEIIPAEVLYPLAESRARYEAHISFSTPATIDQMIDALLLCSNSIRQDVDGKMEFRSVEQLASSFHVQQGQNHILDDLIEFRRSDRRITQPFNVFEAVFNDLDSQYLEKPLSPVQLEVPELLASAGGRRIVNSIDFSSGGRTINLNRWQALKILRILAADAVNDLEVEFEGTARLYQVIKGDLIELTHEDGDFDQAEFIVAEATDNSPEETADTRRFLLKEWDPDAVIPPLV